MYLSSLIVLKLHTEYHVYNITSKRIGCSLKLNHSPLHNTNSSDTTLDLPYKIEVPFRQKEPSACDQSIFSFLFHACVDYDTNILISCQCYFHTLFMQQHQQKKDSILTPICQQYVFLFISGQEWGPYKIILWKGKVISVSQGTFTSNLCAAISLRLIACRLLKICSRSHVRAL